jgi:hypothetical protein
VNWALYAVAALLAAAALLSVATAGKPRRPLDGGTAAAVVTVNAVLITVLLIAARRLS